MESILQKLKEGNQDALVEVYKLYRNEFIHFAFVGYGCDSDNAKDVFQEVVIAFYDNVKSGKLTVLDSGLKTYLFSIGKFKLINLSKKEARKVTFGGDSLINGQNQTENKMADKEEQEFIKATINRFLNEQCEDCRKVLEMYYFEELDMKTIAEKMGYKNADVAKNKKSICFKKLAESVKKHLGVLLF